MPPQDKLIAVEEHFVTDEYLDKMFSLQVPEGEKPELSFMQNFPRNPKMKDRFCDLKTRLGEMDAAGVDMSVLSLNPPGVQIFSDAASAAELARSTNDALAQMVSSHRERFAALGAVAPQDPAKAADEVRRVMGELKFNGVLIGSHTHGGYLDEEQFTPLLDAIEETDATLYLHPRSPSPQMIQPYMKYGMVAALWGFQAEAGVHAMRIILSGTLDRHPRLRIVLGHLGEALPFWLWRLDNIYQRTMQWAGDQLGMVKLKMKPSEYFSRNFWVTTSGMSDPAVLEYCVGKIGAEKILFAVDYPYEDSDVSAKALAAADLRPEQREAIRHGNAERLFRLGPR